jgi:hypothetical protein
MSDRPRFLLLVEICPDRRLPPEEPDPPVAVTLRRVAKCLWRAHRVKLLRIQEAAGVPGSLPTLPSDGAGGAGDR